MLKDGVIMDVVDAEKAGAAAALEQVPAYASLIMQLGADGMFVWSGIFKSGDPASRAGAIVKATTNDRDAEVMVGWARAISRKESGWQSVAGREDMERRTGETKGGRSSLSVLTHKDVTRTSRRPSLIVMVRSV